MQYFRQKGWSITEIASFTGYHRITIRRALNEPVTQEMETHPRTSKVAVFASDITAWLDHQWTVQRMIEEARLHPDHPYTGSSAAFYDYVRPLKRARKGGLPGQIPVRFDGLPGALLQIDWGEVRQFPFTRPNLGGQIRYFFAARLKYRRWMWVRFTTEMREETVLRCLIAVFDAIGGVPWVVTTDTMKTVTLGRDAENQPIWHPAFAACAAEFPFLPNACALAAGNQKGAVESLVTFVKQNFLVGRTFHDAAHLDEACATWLHRVNVERPSDATECPPAERLGAEQAAFGPLPAVAADYGFYETVKVSRESLVAIATNRYSVPAQLIGQILTARIHLTRVALYAGATRVATHPRHTGRNARIVIPEQYEAVFAHKPRARVMAYRDWLVPLAPVAADYISHLCRKRYAEMEPQMLALYQFAQQVGVAEFLAAIELAHDHQTYGAAYVQAILAQPRVRPPTAPWDASAVPMALQIPQAEVERALEQYEQYVANRAVTLGGGQ